MKPRTLRITSGRGTLLVSEHPDSLFVNVSADSAGTSLFLTDPEAAREVGLLLYRWGRRMKRVSLRQPEQPTPRAEH